MGINSLHLYAHEYWLASHRGVTQYRSIGPTNPFFWCPRGGRGDGRVILKEVNNGHSHKSNKMAQRTHKITLVLIFLSLCSFRICSPPNHPKDVLQQKFPNYHHGTTANSRVKVFPQKLWAMAGRRAEWTHGRLSLLKQAFQLLLCVL